ncbi:MAG TPA: hypothetical protein VGY76_05310 [Solirubrobacteraceae bacterium]|jgi:hypothetical protein|nr:hypothetical protein [Solirubrobacteraceae bacterium]
MSRTNAINTLVGIRIVVGALSWLVPRPAGKLFGLDAKGNPQAPYLARLFGVRDIALAYGAVSSEGEQQRQWLTVGLACDVADSVAGIAGGRRGYLPKFASVLVTATALGAAALGAVALSQE